MSEAERRKAPDTIDGIRLRLRRLALASLRAAQIGRASCRERV